MDVTAGLGIRACVPLLVVLGACGLSHADERLATEGTDDSGTDSITTESIAQCLQTIGIEIERAGEVDGVEHAGIDYDNVDLTDPDVVAQVRSCADSASTEDMMAPGAAPSAVQLEGFEAHIDSLYACFEDHGFHPTRSAPPEGDQISGLGAVTEFAPGETEDPEFDAVSEACGSVAVASEEMVYERAATEEDG
jgi:hypothetical protein